MTRNLIFATVWLATLAGTTLLAAHRIWAEVVPVAIVLIVCAVAWVGNELANRIEDHDHERRTY